MITALVLKEWWLQRRRLAAIAAVSLTSVLLLPMGRGWALLVFGTLPVAATGLRMGGEERARGSLEFLVSRVPSAAWLVRVQFALGGLVVIGLGLFFAAADALHLYDLFWVSITELEPVRFPIRSPAFLLVGSFEAFVYALAFLLGSTASNRRTLMLRWPVLAAGVWLVTAWMLQTTAVLFRRRDAGHIVFDPDAANLLGAGFAALAILLFILTPKHRAILDR